MRRWMVWALLALLWGIDGLFLAANRRTREAVLVLGIAAFFALIGRIVARGQARPRSR